MPSELRQTLIEQAAAQIAGGRGSERARVEEALSTALRGFEDAALLELAQRVSLTGADYGYHPPHPAARAIDHSLARLVVAPESTLHGVEHLTALRGPALLCANHLSFSDAHLLDWLLCRDGHAQLAERLSVLAGPKVYSDPQRRLSSLCFGTIKVPQSAERATGAAVMSRRDVARLAAVALDAVEERRQAGDLVLVFVEGTRSRSGAMQAALPAVSRYLELGWDAIVPIGIAGSERLVPIGDEQAHLTRVSVHVGAPLSPARLWQHAEHKRRLVMDVVGLAIAALLPEPYHGVYGAHDPGLHAARALLERLRG